MAGETLPFLLLNQIPIRLRHCIDGRTDKHSDDEKRDDFGIYSNIRIQIERCFYDTRSSQPLLEVTLTCSTQKEKNGKNHSPAWFAANLPDHKNPQREPGHERTAFKNALFGEHFQKGRLRLGCRECDDQERISDEQQRQQKNSSRRRRAMRLQFADLITESQKSHRLRLLPVAILAQGLSRPVLQSCYRFSTVSDRSDNSSRQNSPARKLILQGNVSRRHFLPNAAS